MIRAASWGRTSQRSAALMGFAAAASILTASPAIASPGYELDPVKSSIATAAELPRGVAIDQASQNLYVTELTVDQNSGAHGQVEQLDSSGVATANSPFLSGDSDYFTGVAVNPATQGIYAYQIQVETPFGTFGTPKMNVFSSTGALSNSFTPTKSSAPQLAADSAGLVYLPNDGTDTIQVFNSSGVLEKSIACTGCPGGAFTEPVSVALDSAANLYAVDLAAGGRAIKFTPSGGSYVYDSILQSGKGAAGLGVDPASNDVFVGDFENGVYHVLAYDSSGVQFDDFGGGVLTDPIFGAVGAGQIAVNQTTRKLYAADSGADKVWIFDRVATIPAPRATTLSASSVGQVAVNLNATVNPKAHGLLDCRFEYTDHADFLAHEFANATPVPCASKPFGSSDVLVSERITGLTPATDYDYKIVAVSNGGTSEGITQAFKTLPPLPPTSTTGAASAIAQTVATLGGTVNPNGGPVSDCHFEYTEQVDFEQDEFAGAESTECLFTPEGTAAEPVSAEVSGLHAGTAYRFRIVATNNSGTGAGLDKAFTTAAETCATNPALCPPPPEELTETPSPTPAPSPASTPAPPSPVKKPLKCRKGFKKKRVHGKVRCVKTKRRRR
jgi:hypothetical protein